MRFHSSTGLGSTYCSVSTTRRSSDSSINQEGSAAAAFAARSSPLVDGLHVSDSVVGNVRPRYNAAPSQELLVIRQNHKTGERSLDVIKWGLIPQWCQDPKGARRPINAKEGWRLS